MSETARLLDEERIRVVVVGDADHPVLGIISGCEIARAVAQRSAAALDEPVSQNMTAEVITCTRWSAISDLMELMTDPKVRHILVVEDGHLSGIVSISDIVKHRLAEVKAEQRAIHEYTAMEYSAERF